MGLCEKKGLTSWLSSLFFGSQVNYKWQFLIALAYGSLHYRRPFCRGLWLKWLRDLRSAQPKCLKCPRSTQNHEFLFAGKSWLGPSIRTPKNLIRLGNCVVKSGLESRHFEKKLEKKLQTQGEKSLISRRKVKVLAIYSWKIEDNKINVNMSFKGQFISFFKFMHLYLKT